MRCISIKSAFAGLQETIPATPPLYCPGSISFNDPIGASSASPEGRSKGEFHGKLNDSRIACIEPIVATDIAQDLTKGG